VVWDGGLAAERLTSLPEYKAQRPPMPADLERQIEQIQSYLEAASVPSICHDGVEADDLIATLTRQAVADGAWVVIASSDKDFMQLVSPRVGLLNPNDKSEVIWTAEQVSAKTGVNPEQIVDWLSLIGDSVDNIPGVTGVGPKTAAELINQHGSTAEIYRNLPAVPRKSCGRINVCSNAVERNRCLIRLKDDLPGADTVDRFEVRADYLASRAVLNGDSKHCFRNWKPGCHKPDLFWNIDKQPFFC
jgi:DNA polymerase-1